MKTVLLIGLGRFGRHLAMQLNELGHQVMAVDKDEERVNECMSFVTNAQIGDSTRVDFLRSLGVSNYDVCYVTISGNFQNSLETTSLLKELGAKYVVSRAERDVPAESHVERTDQRPAFLHLLHYAVDVAGPLLCRFFAVQIHFDRLVVIDRMDPTLLSVVGFDANVDCLVDSTGQHESQVVVGMFADQVDASGRSEERRSVAVHFFE